MSDMCRLLNSVSPPIIAAVPLSTSIIDLGAALTSSVGNMFRSIIVALYRFMSTQTRESSAGFTHYYA
jgi:hypothetical protein